MNFWVRNSSEGEALASDFAHSHFGTPLAVQVLSRLLDVTPGDLRHIPDHQREDWIRRFGERGLAKLRSLSREKNVSIFGDALLSFGIQAGRSDFAEATFAALCSPSFPYDLQQRAQRQLQILRGGGSFGDRFEHNTRNLVSQISDPTLFCGMFAAGIIFQPTRLVTLGRLLTSPISGPLTRGLGAEAVAFGAASLLELSAFTFGTQGARELTGHPQNWSPQALVQDLFANGLTLSAFKGSQAAGGAAMRRLQAATELSSDFVRFSASAIPQFSTFAGVLGLHGLEMHFHLRQPDDFTSAVFDSLATTLQFHASGKILEDFGMEFWQQRLQEYRLRFDSLSRPGRPGASDFFPSPAGRVPAMQAEGASVSHAVPEPRVSMVGNVLMSSGEAELGKPFDTPPQGSFGERFSDLKAELSEIEVSLWELPYGEKAAQWPNTIGQLIKESLPIIGEVRKRIELDPTSSASRLHLDDLTMEYLNISRLLSHYDKLQRQQLPLPSVLNQEITEFVRCYCRSVNTLINFLNDAHHIHPPIKNARDAISWLQVARINSKGRKTDPLPTGQEQMHFPYQFLPDGGLGLTREPLAILVFGDNIGENKGDRTLELVHQGHTITHVNSSSRRKSETVQGLVREDFEKRGLRPVTVNFIGEGEQHRPVDLIETYFPKELNELAPSRSPERLAQLRKFLETLNAKLKPDGSALVLSEHNKAIVTLAKLIRRDPILGLLRARYLRTHMPVLGGRAASIGADPMVISWLVYHKTGALSPNPHSPDQNLQPRSRPDPK